MTFRDHSWYRLGTLMAQVWAEPSSLEDPQCHPGRDSCSSRGHTV